MSNRPLKNKNQVTLNFSIVLLDKTQQVAVFKVLANKNFQIRYKCMGIQLNQQQRRSQNHTSGYVPKLHFGEKKKKKVVLNKEFEYKKKQTQKIPFKKTQYKEVWSNTLVNLSLIKKKECC